MTTALGRHHDALVQAIGNAGCEALLAVLENNGLTIQQASESPQTQRELVDEAIRLSICVGFAYPRDPGDYVSEGREAHAQGARVTEEVIERRVRPFGSHQQLYPNSFIGWDFHRNAPRRFLYDKCQSMTLEPVPIIETD